MKLTGLIVLLLSAGIATAQIPGEVVRKPVSIWPGWTMAAGDTLYLGTGQLPDGDFKYIYQPKNWLAGAPERYLSKRFTNKYVIVEKIKVDNVNGAVYYAVINPDYNYNKLVNLIPAAESGELVAVNRHRVAPVVSAVTASGSLADELAKLKKLLDQGVLTPAEFEAAKKKLLGN